MRVTLIAFAILLASVAPAFAQPPRASLPDIEDEVMCVECGTVLAVSNSPVAQQERAFIRTQIAAGKDKAQIKAAMVEEYGDNVLAEPKGGGFSSTLWIVPIVLVLLGGIAVFVATRRWRRSGPAPQAPEAPGLSAEDARRLDAELRA
jgi:cytochrome c-type biogenesis protein CcmH